MNNNNQQPNWSFPNQQFYGNQQFPQPQGQPNQQRTFPHHPYGQQQFEGQQQQQRPHNSPQGGAQNRGQPNQQKSSNTPPQDTQQPQGQPSQAKPSPPPPPPTPQEVELNDYCFELARIAKAAVEIEQKLANYQQKSREIQNPETLFENPMESLRLVQNLQSEVSMAMMEYIHLNDEYERGMEKINVLQKFKIVSGAAINQMFWIYTVAEPGVRRQEFLHFREEFHRLLMELIAIGNGVWTRYGSEMVPKEVKIRMEEMQEEMERTRRDVDRLAEDVRSFGREHIDLLSKLMEQMGTLQIQNHQPISISTSESPRLQETQIQDSESLQNIESLQTTSTSSEDSDSGTPIMTSPSSESVQKIQDIQEDLQPSSDSSESPRLQNPQILESEEFQDSESRPGSRMETTDDESEDEDSQFSGIPNTTSSESSENPPVSESQNTQNSDVNDHQNTEVQHSDLQNPETPESSMSSENMDGFHDDDDAFIELVKKASLKIEESQKKDSEEDVETRKSSSVDSDGSYEFLYQLRGTRGFGQRSTSSESSEAQIPTSSSKLGLRQATPNFNESCGKPISNDVGFDRFSEENAVSFRLPGASKKNQNRRNRENYHRTWNRTSGTK